MFWQVRQSNYDWKKGTVVWPLVGMFGGSMSLDCFGGFLDQIMTRKIGTGNLQIGMALSIK
jgi:hypothetical protein